VRDIILLSKTKPGTGFAEKVAEK